MKGLDIFLTTDPNDQIDWGDMGACCHFCGEDVFEHLDTDTDKETVMLKCDACGHEFEFKYEPQDCTPIEPSCKHCQDLDLMCKHCGLGG